MLYNMWMVLLIKIIFVSAKTKRDFLSYHPPHTTRYRVKHQTAVSYHPPPHTTRYRVKHQTAVMSGIHLILLTDKMKELGALTREAGDDITSGFI